MKKIYLLSAAVLSILAAASCAREENGPETFRTVISASIAPTKTALGEKEGEAWPNYWKAGDQISVNGVTSEALGSEADGNATATFTFESLISTPYNAVYPASAVSDYSDGSATVTLPASQNYVAGSYDPAAFIMGGKSTDEAKLSLSPCVSLIHLSLTGTASISKVKLTGAENTALSGSFTTDFSGYTPKAVSNVVEMVAETPVALPAEFFIAVPAGLNGALNVEIFDAEGGSMSKNATLKSALAPGQVYSPAALAYTASYDIAITAEGITSSTAVICWDNSPEAAYTIGVYEDEGCNSLLDSYAVDAGNACWGGQSPRFCISGLAAGTTYYVKVSNTAKNVDSNILPVTTAPFDIVEVSSEPAAAGDVILAEDFSELRWDCDMIGGGAGWFPTTEAQASFSTVGIGSFQAAATSNEKQLSSQTNALASSRLMHWAQGANKNMYIHPGYIKLVGSSKVTHLVTPALNNIPEGSVATVEVEITASAYYSESSGSFCTDKAVVAVQTGEIGELLADATNTLDLESNIASITLRKETAWNTYKVTLKGVSKGDRLAFGADKSVTKNEARMNISDMKVTIKELYDADGLTASLKSVSSSTATFSWTHVGVAGADVSKPYSIALYSDAACSNLIVSHEFEAEASCWDGKIPCFSIGGLAPSTTYWFVATDTEGDIVSNKVEATTSAFTPVDATTVTNAAAGDVILAEDFSEIGWGPDEFAVAAGFVPSEKNLNAPAGENPEGIYTAYNNTGNRIFGAGVDLGDSRLSHGWGFFGNSAVYLRNAYLRIATTASEARTHLVTPSLAGIPEGKFATLEVTATLAKMENNDNDVAVFVNKGLTMNTTTDLSSASYKKYTGASLSGGYAFGVSAVKEWETKTVSIGNVDAQCQLVIGSLEDISGKNRFNISDIVVKITSLYDEAVPELKARYTNSSSSTLVFAWSEGISTDEDVSKAYTATLYKDSGCTTVEQSFDIPQTAGSAWKNKEPKFVFGGLDPSTSYWFQVTNTTDNRVSNVVKATTDDFTVVEMPSSITETGVVLAEDFGEIRWEFDYPFGAMGFRPASTSSFANTEVKTSETNAGNGIYNGYHREGGGEMTFKGQGTAIGNSRLQNWLSDSNVYIHPGYLKLGTSSARGWILTPEFTVPEGKKAIVTVSVTAGRYSSGQDSNWALVVLTPELAKANPSAYTASFDWPDTEDSTLYQEISFTNNNTWTTKSIEGLEIRHGDRIAFGGRKGGDSKKGRVHISDMVVTVTEIVDE